MPIWCRAGRSRTMLSDHERELADYIIEGLVERLHAESPKAPSVPEGYIDARAMAGLLGRNVEVVRRNGAKIPGAIKIAGRWCFDPKALQAKQEQPAARAPRRRPQRSDVPLLPIRP
jgi:hypothetical protein